MKKSKYDVAIVGVGVGANYGSVLTYYSLYRYVESLGNKVLMVSKIGAKDKDIELADTHAIRFAKKHYNLSKVYSLNNVSELNNLADTFLVGSDQVWNYGVAKNFGYSFYLDFVDKGKRKISYAASFGHAIDFADAEQREKIKPLLQDFNKISVREDSGVVIAKNNYGVEATQVIEPIFLTSANEYINLSKESSIDNSGNYLLAYILDPTDDKRKAIQHVAKKLGLDVKIILDGFPNLFKENKRKMGMDESIQENVNVYDFLKLYSKCSFVITDSFHGTAFAIRFKKNFITIGNKRRGMARFNSLFNLIGNKSHFTLNPLKIISNEKFLEEIDYSTLDEIINERINFSKKWLTDALKSNIHRKLNQLNNGKNIECFISKVKFLLKLNKSNLDFKSNNGWIVEKTNNSTMLKLENPQDAKRGNFVWVNLDKKIRRQKSYKLSIEWSFKTESDFINIHLRNSVNGKFKVIGRIATSDFLNVMHRDNFFFSNIDPDYNQVMFGAVHFKGNDSHIVIKSITLNEIDNIENNKNGQNKLLSGSVIKAKKIAKIDSDRFINNYAIDRKAHNKRNAQALMMFYSHGIEKGLSRTNNFRPRFGSESIALLGKEMNKWIENDKISDPFFQIATSVLHNYLNRHNELGIDISDLWSNFNDKVRLEISNSTGAVGGTLSANIERLTKKEEKKLSFDGKSFIQIIYGRRSIREFIDSPVNLQSLELAIHAAIQSPSVCNRQPAKVHVIQDKNLMKPILSLQGGFNGYAMPPVLLLVTSDLSAFIGAVERNQGYIDGGLFIMSLLLALENYGLGACCLNAAMTHEKEDTIRKLLKLSDSEILISFVAVGNFNKQLTVPRSNRLSVSEVTVFNKPE